MSQLQFDKNAHLATLFGVLVVNNVRIKVTSDPYGGSDVEINADDMMSPPPASGHLLNVCRSFVLLCFVFVSGANISN